MHGWQSFAKHIHSLTANIAAGCNHCLAHFSVAHAHTMVIRHQLLATSCALSMQRISHVPCFNCTLKTSWSMMRSFGWAHELIAFCRSKRWQWRSSRHKNSGMSRANAEKGWKLAFHRLALVLATPFLAPASACDEYVRLCDNSTQTLGRCSFADSSGTLEYTLHF